MLLLFWEMSCLQQWSRNSVSIFDRKILDTLKNMNIKIDDSADVSNRKAQIEEDDADNSMLPVVLFTTETVKITW